MYKFLILLCMLFCHIVDDYYLQGWLASAKQKSWWEENHPNRLYENDFIMALCEHAFSWAFVTHIPIIIYLIVAGIEINVFCFTALFIFHWLIHSMTDNLKANLLKINLIQDQIIHILQIVVLWFIYVFII